MDVSKRLPFIGEMISSLIVLAVTFLFLKEQFLLMAIVLLVGLAVFRLNAWVVTAAVLISLFLEYRDDPEKTLILIGLLALGVVWQIIVALVSAVRPEEPTSPTFGQVLIFALIGTAVFISSAYFYCRPAFEATPVQIFGTTISPLQRCTYCFGLAPGVPACDPNAYDTFPSDPFAMFEVLAGMILRMQLMLPTYWAALFAAVRQLNFRLTRVGRLLLHFWLSAIVGSVAGMPAAALQLLLTWYAPPSALPGQSDVAFYGLLLLVAASLLLMAVGTAWGARLFREK